VVDNPLRIPAEGGASRASSLASLLSFAPSVAFSNVSLHRRQSKSYWSYWSCRGASCDGAWSG